MGDPTVRVEAADKEAAAWHMRLGSPGVAAQDIQDFFVWRSASQVNADAYRRVEAIWGQAAKLKPEGEIGQALSEALARRREDAKAGTRLWGGAAAVGAAIILSLGGWFWWQGRTSFETSVGEQRLVQLADGSSVRLDTDSRVRVRFDDERRLIELEDGQALFEVVHDPSRPFVVQAGQVQVTAVGTVFDVRREPAGASVTLVSGVVDVVGPGVTRNRMQAGTRARVQRGAAEIDRVDVRAQTSWTEGKITFRDTPLRDAVEEVNRYLTEKIELDAAGAEDVLINGVFRTGDRDAFVSTASEGLGLQASAQPDGAVRLSEPQK